MEGKTRNLLAKKKKFELIGVGSPTDSAGVPVTYMCSGNLTTVYVFGLHPSRVMDCDYEHCKVIGNRELAEHAIETVKSIWQWFCDNRDFAVHEYLFGISEREREQRILTSGEPSLG